MELRPLKASILALLLLAPALLCAADRGIPALRDAGRRLSAAESIHCFCHDASLPGEGTLRAPDTPSPRALYFPVAAADLRPIAGDRLVFASPPAPPVIPAPEPLTPPPINRI